MSKQAFAIFRAAKLKQGRGNGSFARSWKHLENHDVVGLKMHPERAEHNKTIVGRLVSQNGIKAVLGGIKSRHNKVAPRALRCDAPIGIELLFSYSQKDATKMDLQYINDFEDALMSFVAKELPQFKCLRLDRHCDEESVHWHLIGTCIDDRGRICIKDALGGPKNMARLQTAFAEAVKHLGLRRGIPKTALAEEEQRRHKTKQEWLREQAMTREERERAYQDTLASIGL